MYAEVQDQLVFNPFEYRHEGNYHCRVYNDLGDELSNMATLQAGKLWTSACPELHCTDNVRTQKV